MTIIASYMWMHFILAHLKRLKVAIASLQLPSQRKQKHILVTYSVSLTAIALISDSQRVQFCQRQVLMGTYLLPRLWPQKL